MVGTGANSGDAGACGRGGLVAVDGLVGLAGTVAAGRGDVGAGLIADGPSRRPGDVTGRRSVALRPPDSLAVPSSSSPSSRAARQPPS